MIAHVLLALAAREALAVPVFDEVEFAPNDGLDAVLLGLGHELERAEHVAMVGQRHAFLAVGLGLGHHGFDGGGTVEQRKLGVVVQMDELGHDAAGFVLSQNNNPSPGFDACGSGFFIESSNYSPGGSW